jgi:VIT1/CCC1 family predicted Fe2+/Mn2+ transporter
MHRWILNNFSTEWLLFFSAAICIGIAFATQALSRRYLPRFQLTFFSDNTYFARALVTSTSILFAFTIIVLWQNLIFTKDLVTKEADAFSKIILHSKIFPSEERKRIEKAIGEYLQIVINKEWPLMREGKSSADAETAIANIDAAFEAYSPKTAFEQIFYKEVLTHFSEAYEARHARLEKVASVIPAELYAVIVLVMLLLLIAGALIKAPEAHSHKFWLLVTSTVIGVNLAIITTFDYPFSGEISVDNKPLSVGVLEGVLKKI